MARNEKKTSKEFIIREETLDRGLRRTAESFLWMENEN